MTLDIVQTLFEIVAFLFAITVHESAHAWTANRCGDPTARMLGRITLNPIKHIDPIGTIVMPAIAYFSHFPLIGWAKPTPVDPRHFKNPVRDDILTSLAGPISNLLVAAGATICLAIISKTSAEGHEIVGLIGNRVLPNSSSPLVPLALMMNVMMYINVLLAAFNVIPVPPLDGSHVLRHFLPESARKVYDTVGMFGLIALFLVGGPVISFLMAPMLAFFHFVLTRL